MNDAEPSAPASAEPDYLRWKQLPSGSMQMDANGKWVTYEDYAALRAQLAQVERAMRKVRQIVVTTTPLCARTEATWEILDTITEALADRALAQKGQEDGK